MIGDQLYVAIPLSQMELRGYFVSGVYNLQS
jgi:hypothetical protein